MNMKQKLHKSFINHVQLCLVYANYSCYGVSKKAKSLQFMRSPIRLLIFKVSFWIETYFIVQ